MPPERLRACPCGRRTRPCRPTRRARRRKQVDVVVRRREGVGLRRASAATVLTPERAKAAPTQISRRRGAKGKMSIHVVDVA